MRNKFLEVNAKFCRMLNYDITKAHIMAGVMLWDEYRLYQWLESGRPARMIVDVGGHYGSFTAMAKILWPQSTVRAYEPHPYSAGEFRKNTSEFGGVTLIEAAAIHPLMAKSQSFSDASVRLHLSPGDNDGGHTVRSPSDREFVIVQSVLLMDDLIRAGIAFIDILKLDCEGVEAGLLEDMQQADYLRSVDYICGEWHGPETIPRIKAALRHTHLVEICLSGDSPVGAFFAWRQ